MQWDFLGDFLDDAEKKALKKVFTLLEKVGIIFLGQDANYRLKKV